MNNFLPANIGTFVTLMMFTAIIPACTFAGAIAAYLVQKIFFTIAGTLVYLYLFLSVPGSFNENLGNLSEHPGASILIAAGAGFLIVILGRIFWKELKELWEKAKEGGVILSHRREYLNCSFLPAFLSWLCKLAVTDLPGGVRDPGHVRVDHVGDRVGFAGQRRFGYARRSRYHTGDERARSRHLLRRRTSTAVDYSTAQQLITTAWNILLALVLVVLVFGWTGGKLLVGQSYTDAKVKVAEQKTQRADKKAQKQAERATSGESRFHRRHDPERTEDASSSRGGDNDV